MVGLGETLPVDEIRTFLGSLARITGLRFSLFTRGENYPNVILGEKPFCMKLRTTLVGDERCSESYRHLLNLAHDTKGTVFDMCHAGLGMTTVPLTLSGNNVGTLVISQAVVGDLSEEHLRFLRSLEEKVGLEETGFLLEAVRENPQFDRSRMKNLAHFVIEQLTEKLTSREMLEDTTQFLLEKYEELMFLYTITESISPDREYRKTLSVILDKGLQKLSAKSGFFVLAAMGDAKELVALEGYGDYPWEGKPEEVPQALSELIYQCRGPAVIIRPEEAPPEWRADLGALLAYPFEIKNFRRGYLIFAWENVERIGEIELKFAKALANQAASVLHGVHLYRELADLLFSTLTMLKIAGLLHDFGKIGIAEGILTKEGKLTEEERESMKEHPAIGASILSKFRSFSNIVPGIRHHHERFDGLGYPQGLAGDEIPLVGRIISIADAYDAMTTSRPYRRKMDSHEAQEELLSNAKAQFDPRMVEAFIQALEERQ
jgi:ligand-binding sensor protein